MYDRYIVVLTKRAANENLKVMQMKTSYLHFTVSCFVAAGLNVILSTVSLEILFALEYLHNITVILEGLLIKPKRANCSEA